MQQPNSFIYCRGLGSAKWHLTFKRPSNNKTLCDRLRVMISPPVGGPAPNTICYECAQHYTYLTMEVIS